MSSLESQLQEAQAELSKIVESSPEAKLKRQIEKIKAKQHKEAVKKVQGAIKGNKGAISREIKRYEEIKERMADMREAIEELDNEASVSRIKQRNLGTVSADLNRQLQELQSPIPIISDKRADSTYDKMRDRSQMIYEEEDSDD